jgi:hypothetical protein
MKIKMRSDEADASSTSELTTMSGWLAELREDDQAEPGSGGSPGRDSGGGSAGTDSRGHDETESQSHPGMAIRSHTGTDNRASTGTDRRPSTGTDNRASTGTDSRASTGTDNRPYTGTDRRGSTGTDRRPFTGTNNQAYTGTDRRPYTGANNRPSTGTDSRGHVQSAGEAGPRAMASAAAPPNTYAFRRGAGARAKVSARAETFPVRALIGDELRMPITWCEMGSCISWHADREALGEADNRARAIRAGWRIDALGRIACPRCQQTSTSFRATRPVVPWDRATAIVRAARAAAGPGYRNTGSVPRPNGRGTRRPATGQR